HPNSPPPYPLPLHDALPIYWKAAWAFYAPTAILLLLLVAWPIGQAIYMSFTRTLGSSLQIGPFIGLKNYTDLLSDAEFWFSLGRSEEHTSELQSRGHLVCRL